MIAIQTASVSGYFAATAVAGVGFGSGLQGGTRTVLPLAQPTLRTGLLTAIFLISYTGMGIPEVIAGWLVSRGQDLTHVADGYALVIVALAIAALVGLTRPSEHKN